MTFDEIKTGMIFKENDNRFERYVRVMAVEKSDHYIVLRTCTKNGLPCGLQTTSTKPERFHTMPRSKGYSLIAAERGNDEN